MQGIHAFMSWLMFAFSGPILWALSAHLDKYLVEKYFKQSHVAVLLIFTALIGLFALPVIWLAEPRVMQVGLRGATLMVFSGMLYMTGMLFYLRALPGSRSFRGRAVLSGRAAFRLYPGL